MSSSTESLTEGGLCISSRGHVSLPGIVSQLFVDLSRTSAAVIILCVGKCVLDLSTS